MPTPTPANAVSRADLGAIAYEYMVDQTAFIGGQVMPVFEVGEKNGEYPIITIESLLSRQTTSRAPRASYSRSDWKFKMGNYDCAEHGWEELLDDSELRMYRRLFDAEEVSVLRATNVVMQNHERRVAAALFNTANAISDAAATAAWSDAANATPKADVVAATTAMRDGAGLTPNACVMSKRVFDNLLVTDELKNYLQYTSPHLVDGLAGQIQTVARYFSVAQVMVGDRMENTAAKSKAAVLADIWDNDFVSLCRVSNSMDLRDPAFGRSFLWTADSPGILTTEQYRVEEKRSEAYRVRQNIDESVVFIGANSLITGVTA